MESCLTSLIGIKGWCEPPGTEPQVWLENIEGIDKIRLAELSSTLFPSGQKLGEHLIQAAASEVATDLESLLPKAFSIRRLISNICSSCTLQPLYQSGKNGIIVKNVSLSEFSSLGIESLQILVNNTGTFNVTITDGVTPKTFDVLLQAGVIQPVENIHYKTKKSKVEIFFTDFNTVNAASILCPTTGGCGCGQANTSPLSNGFTITGMSAGIESTTQYGFLPCVIMTCEQDDIMCRLINYSPRAFAATMLYKTASKFFQTSRLSQRNNRTASFDNDQKEDMVTKYDTLYKEMLTGGDTRKGITELINTNLQFIKDRCIECNTRVSAVYAHG